MCILGIHQQNDSTTKAPPSPRIPPEVSECDKGPVDKTEKHVSDEDPGAETGRQEVWSDSLFNIYHNSSIYNIIIYFLLFI